MPPPSGDPGRQLVLLKFAVGFLVLFALAVLVLPGPIPKPLRVIVAATDLAAAAAIWLLARQRIKR